MSATLRHSYAPVNTHPLNEQEKKISPISELYEWTEYSQISVSELVIYRLTINYILDICNIIVSIIMHSFGPMRRFPMARPVNGNNIELYRLNTIIKTSTVLSGILSLPPPPLSLPLSLSI